MKRIITFLIVFVLMCGLFSVSALAQTSDENAFYEFSPQYKDLSIFQDNVSTAQLQDGTNIVIDINNNQLMSVYANNISYSDGFVYAMNDSAVILYSIAGQVVQTYSGIGAKKIIRDRIAIKDEELMQQLYDLNGNKLLDQRFDDIVYGEGDCVFLNDGEKIELYDLNEKKTVMTGISRCTSVSKTFVICIKDGKYGVVDFNGSIKIPFQYNTILTGESGYFRCDNGSALEIYDSNYQKKSTISAGTVVGIADISDGLMLASDADGNICYINLNGEKVISRLECNFDVNSCSSFYEGYAVVRGNGECSYIDKTGHQVTDKSWDNAYRFANGYALVMNRRFDDTLQDYKEHWYIIDTNFEIVKALNCEVYGNEYYQDGYDFSDGYIRTVDSETGLMGFIKLGVQNSDDNKSPDDSETEDTTTPGTDVEGDETQEGTENTPSLSEKDVFGSLIEKLGITRELLLIITGGFVAAIVLIVVFVAVKRKRR